ncbi:methyl-accepting chemotaxis protein [Schlesneria sp.]|uniref:methyl-accepting chemotaxis protein n=1 Tax=Schlesneria sp. TaxID=2762018 RepID=UPI002F1CE855
MKNFKLASKMMILTSILISTIIVVAWVAADRLAAVNVQVRQLVDSTFYKLNLTSDIHVKVLASIRAQKNAVLSPDDDVSRSFATFSRSSLVEARETLGRLKEVVIKEGIEGQTTSVDECIKSLDKAEEINNKVLDLAVQNSNVKARKLLGSEIQRQVEILETRLQSWVDDASSKTEMDASVMERMKTLYELQDQLMGILPNAMRHINASAEEDMLAFEKKLDELQERIQHGLPVASAGDGPSQVDARNRLNDIKTSLASLIVLSRLDSNNQSVVLSLNASRVASEDCVQRIVKLDELFSIEAKSGRDMSNVAYLNAFRSIIGMTLVGVILGSILAYLVKESVTRPVFEVRNLAQAMADGDLRQRIHLKQKDEVGELSDATNSLADSLTNIVAQIQKVSEALAGSADELSGVSNQLLSQSETTSLNAASVASSSEELSSNISTMAAAAEQMSVNVASISSASEEMSVNVGTISSAAEQTSHNVGAVSSAVVEISSSFTDVLNDVREGSLVAGEASRMADSATATIQTLSQSGTEISKVTETIKMIALQTNLLALNATIEATSAGEAGKGFAVVAHEIKELANQSAKAAEDIARKIEGVQNDTRQAVQVIQNVSQIIKDINSSAGRISQSVEKQTQAATMISQNVSEANKGVGDIARSISEVAKAAGDMSRNVAEAARGATDVSRNVGEAAKAASGISSDIHGVSVASRSTNLSASKVHQSAEHLDKIGKELRKLVGRFKINKEDTVVE